MSIVQEHYVLGITIILFLYSIYFLSGLLAAIRLLTKFISTKAEMSGVTKLNSLRDLLAFCSVSVGSDVDVEVDVNGDVIEGLLDSEYESGLGLDKDTLNDYVNEFDTISLVLGLFPKPKGDGTSSKTDAAKSMDAIGVESRNGELPSEEELIAMGGRKAPGISSNTSFVDSVYNASPGVVTTPGRSKAEEAFLTVAYNYQSGRFATTDDEWLCKHFDVSENTIIAFGDGSVNANAQVIAKMTLTASTPSNEPQDVDERDATQLALFEEMHEKIVAFLATHSMPLVTVFSPETLGLIETSVLKVHVLLFLDENTEHASILRPGMASVAKLYRGSALFIEVPATEHQVSNM